MKNERVLGSPTMPIEEVEWPDMANSSAKFIKKNPCSIKYIILYNSDKMMFEIYWRSYGQTG